MKELRDHVTMVPYTRTRIEHDSGSGNTCTSTAMVAVLFGKVKSENVVPATGTTVHVHPVLGYIL